MAGKKVCMFVYNNCKSDARVLKEAKTLTDAGFSVRIIAVLTEDVEPYEKRDGFEIIRVIKNPLHYRILKKFRGATKSRPRKKVSSRLNLFFIKGRNGLLRWLFLTVSFPYRSYRRTVKRVKGSEPQFQLGLKDFLKKHYRAFLKHISKHGLLSYIKKAAKENPWPFLLYGWLAVIISYMARGLKYFFRYFLYFFFYKPKSIVKKTIYNALKNLLMRYHRPLCFKDYYERAFKIIEQDPADFYHGHDLHTLPVIAMAKEKLGGKAIYDSHELYTEISTLSKAERRKYRRLEKRLTPKADKVITVNKSIAGELAERYSIPKPIVLMNCPPSPGFTTTLQKNILKEKLNIPAHEPLILYQGGYAPNRGLDKLILAAKHFKRGIMVYMGWGNIEDDLKALVIKQGLANRVLFTDPVPQDILLNYTRCADVGLIPYRFIGLNNYYTSPNKLFEYINANIAIAGSNFPELERIVEGYEVGKTFNPESPESIAKAVNDILADDSRLREMKANTIEAAKIFNWEVESKKLINLYNQMLEDDRAA